jgi:hypothetical protein
MAITLPPLTELVPKTLAELDSSGFACVENCVSDRWLERTRSEVTDHLAAHGEKFFSIIRPADRAGSPFAELVGDPAIQGLMRELTARACPQGAIDTESTYNVLRVIAGPEGERGSHQYHFDASVVTILVPIFMPEAARGAGGELITFPAFRPYRRSVLANLADKLRHQNRFAWNRVARRVDAHREAHMQVLLPGNIYLFWGYRTLHGNLACAPGSLRATLLVHYGNPHGRSRLLGLIRRLRQGVEARRRTAS